MTAIAQMKPKNAEREGSAKSGNGERCRRMLAAGAFVAGAVLLARGKRKAGLAAATLGTVVTLIDEPESLSSAWVGLPAYLRTGQRFLTRAEGFVEEMGRQGDRVRTLLTRQPG